MDASVLMSLASSGLQEHWSTRGLIEIHVLKWFHHSAIMPPLPECQSMISRIEMRNFISHSCTVIELAAGLTGNGPQPQSSFGLNGMAKPKTS